MYKFTQQFVEYCESNLNLEDYKGYDYSSISVVQAFWNDDILHMEIGIETEGNQSLPSMKMICLWKRAENYS